MLTYMVQKKIQNPKLSNHLGFYSNLVLVNDLVYQRVDGVTIAVGAKGSARIPWAVAAVEAIIVKAIA
jgi:hypothetical protein